MAKAKVHGPSIHGFGLVLVFGFGARSCLFHVEALSRQIFAT